MVIIHYKTICHVLPYPLIYPSCGSIVIIVRHPPIPTHNNHGGVYWILGRVSARYWKMRASRTATVLFRCVRTVMAPSQLIKAIETIVVSSSSIDAVDITNTEKIVGRTNSFLTWFLIGWL